MQSFSSFASLCEKVRALPSKNAKIDAIAQYLLELDDISLMKAALFLSGLTFPKGSGLALNVGYSTIMQSLSDITQLDAKEIEGIYLQHGDMGALAEYAVSKKQQFALIGMQLSISELHEQITKIADAKGSGAAEAKRKILTGLLLNCTPLEARYLIRVIIGELRIGVVEGLMELAIAKAFERQIQAVHQAMLLSGDIAQIAVLAKKDALSSVVMKPLNPLSFMLADVMFSAEEIAEYYKKPLICEFKYDGIRVQLHKVRDQIKLFSRTLDDVTQAFPDIEKAAATLSNDLILDGEIIAYQNGHPLHFQELQKRLRRKIVTEQVLLEIPVVYLPYDVMYLDGQPVIGKPLAYRKKLLSEIQIKSPILSVSFTIVKTVDEIASAFTVSKEQGHEGLVLKDPDSLYHPGKRGRHWAKLKHELDTIDAVIVHAEYGHGKRAGSLSDYTFAVRDSNSLKVIGKAYSGLTDTEIQDMTTKLRLITEKDQGYKLTVKPEIILEIAFDSIQRSERHDSGYALRFPRIKRIRSDKTVHDIDDLEKVRRIYEMQLHVKSR